jgi:hypothetical protein
MQAIVDEWKAGGAVKDQLGGTAKLSKCLNLNRISCIVLTMIVFGSS